MQKFIQLIVSLLLCTQLATAQERQIKILNPDGTPATDAKAVTVLDTPGGVVDQELKPRQMPNVEEQPLKELFNEIGTVTMSDAKAIVASNEQGFLFLPAAAFGDQAKLREWARVELDVSTIPEDKRADLRLSVMWTNSVQGSFIRPETPAKTDAFIDLDLPVSKEPNPDWRFDPMITWWHTVPVVNQTLRVPPGEILISLASKQVSDNSEVFAEMPPGSFVTNVGLWRVPGGTTQKISLPDFGTVEGTISDQSMLPDWSKSGSETTRIVLNNTSFLTLPALLQPTGSNDQYFSRLMSNEGFRERQNKSFNAMTTAVDGKFRFELVPVADYSIAKLEKITGLPSGSRDPARFQAVPLAADDGGTAPSIQVALNELTTLNGIEFRFPAPVPAQSAIGNPFSNPSVDSTNPSDVPAGARIVYEERVRIIDGKEVKQMVARTVSPESPELFEGGGIMDNPTPASPFQQEPSRFFAPDDAPAPDPKPSAATVLIQNWLRTAKDPADQTELRKLLQDHLQEEFDANQKSRQAEIERLQQLLGKSKEWLNKRQERRDEIIKKRIEELLRQQELSKPEESSLRR